MKLKVLLILFILILLFSGCTFFAQTTFLETSITPNITFSIINPSNEEIINISSSSSTITLKVSAPNDKLITCNWIEKGKILKSESKTAKDNVIEFSIDYISYKNSYYTTLWAYITDGVSLIKHHFTLYVSLPLIPTPINCTYPIPQFILIENGAKKTNNPTPIIILSAQNADQMAFSGNGIHWTPWIRYNATYNTFNLNTSPGCISGDGEKTVYVKFKNDCGESSFIYDTIVMDTKKPHLESISWEDIDGDNIIDKGDLMRFKFNEKIDTSTINLSNIEQILFTIHTYDAVEVNWDIEKTTCFVVLGDNETIVGGETVILGKSIEDIAGNSVDTTVTEKIPIPIPNPPMLNTPITPTRQDTQILIGAKDSNTSIWINGEEKIAINSDTTWIFTVTLSEGDNSFDIFSKNESGRESDHITINIIYDPKIYVSPNGDDLNGEGTEIKPYKTLSKAIALSSPGDTIFVGNGIYNENIVIDKPLIIQGENMSHTIITSSTTSPIVSIISSNVSIENLTVKSEINSLHGIRIVSSSEPINGIIINNTLVSYLYYGIYIGKNADVTVRDSTISHNTIGIRVGGSPGGFLTIYASDIIENDKGIYVEDDGNIDTGTEGGISPGENNIYNNSIYGIHNNSTNIVYAQNNWWGDPDGPKYPYGQDNENCGDWAYWDSYVIIFDPFSTSEVVR